jgi:hypothetical protein
MKEYIVTLHNKEDLEDFYNDMETPGGDLYIPDRAVDLQLRRAISRNTHYMLTDEEALQLKEDPRVWDVESRENLELADGHYSGYDISGNFDRDNFVPSSNDLNWGLYRHIIGDNALSGEWGSDGTRTASSGTNTITASGKNVDVLIVDSVINTTVRNHPEFAVNTDGTGGTRVEHFNWFSLTSALGLGSNGNYDYSDDGEEHGVHVAGIVAGNTQGWARDANIYNIQPFGQNHGNNGLDTTTYWDYIRQWHNNKSINPETGRRNPTISNHSYVFRRGKISGSWVAPVGTVGVGAFRYRGVTLDTWGDEGRDLTDAELEARGIVVDGSGNWAIPFYKTADAADAEDAKNDGIIFVVGSGNDYQKYTKSGSDYNNIVYWRDSGGDQYAESDYSHRTVSGSGMSNSDAIVCGSLDIVKNDRKASFSNCGDACNIHAAGYGIVSAIPGSSGNFQDSRDTSFWQEKKSGTSMSAPQVTGVLALLAESNPNINQAEALEWLQANGTNNAMYDTGADSTLDFESLQGAANLILRWVNQRPETGMSFPKQNAKARPTSGRTYPRPRMRVRG